MRYLGFDLETGGFDKDRHTITEAYFCIWDENWNQLDELHLYMTNDLGEVNGEEQAFKATGIDPEWLKSNPDTVTYTKGREKLMAMLKAHKIPNKRSHYRFLGQNIVYFDIPFMDRQGFFTEEHCKKAGINHNALDTTLMVTWLKDMGMLPSDVGSISSLIDYFNLPKGTAHQAKDDVMMQKEIYIKLCDIIKQAAKNNLGGQQNDLLKIVEF